MSRRNHRRSQAALFDGIMFLLFASVSIVMVYSFLGSYGVAQDQTLRSAYRLSYVDSVGKALYQIHASTLADVSTDDRDFADHDYCRIQPGKVCATNNGQGKPYFDLYGTGDFTCDHLKDFPAQTVADLMKKDLGDAPANENENKVCLDNRFGDRNPSGGSGCAGTGAGLPIVPGKTALRCALKELMKPIESAGFRYFADVLTEEGAAQGSTVVPHTIPQEINPDPAAPAQLITNSYVADENRWTSCEDVRDKYMTTVLGPQTTGRLDIMTASLPFRVPRSDTIQQFFSESLRVCIWKTQVV